MHFDSPSNNENNEMKIVDDHPLSGIASRRHQFFASPNKTKRLFQDSESEASKEDQENLLESNSVLTSNKSVGFADEESNLHHHNDDDDDQDDVVSCLQRCRALNQLRPKGRRPIAEEYFMIFLIFLVNSSYSITLPSIFERLDSEIGVESAESTLGLAVGIYCLGQFISAMGLGSLANKFPLSPLVGTCLIIDIGGQIVYAFSTSLPVLLISRLMTGIGAGMVAASRSYIACHVPPEERTAAMSKLNASQALSFIYGPLAGAGLSTVSEIRHGQFVFNKYTAPAFVSAGISLASLMTLLFFFRSIPRLGHTKYVSIDKTVPVSSSSSSSTTSSSSDESDALLTIELLNKNPPGSSSRRSSHRSLQGSITDSQVAILDMYSSSSDYGNEDDSDYYHSSSLDSDSDSPFLNEVSLTDGSGASTLLDQDEHGGVVVEKLPVKKIRPARKGMLICVLNFFIAMTVFALFETALTPTTATFGWGLVENGIAFSSLAICSIITLVLFNVINNRCFDENNAMKDIFLHLGGLFLQIIGCIITFSWFVEIEPVRFLIGMALLVAIGYSICTVEVLTMYSKLFGTRPAGTMMGYITSTGSVARITGPIMAGFLYAEGGLDRLMQVILALVLITFIATFLTRKHLVPPRPPTRKTRRTVRRRTTHTLQHSSKQQQQQQFLDLDQQQQQSLDQQQQQQQSLEKEPLLKI